MAPTRAELDEKAESLGLDPEAYGNIEDLSDAIAKAEAGDQAKHGEGEPVANAELEHSEGGVTTRDDKLDAGVPMTPGSPKEPQGPEDALGEGDKRGDYRDRVPGRPHESRPIPGGGAVVTKTVSRKTGAEVSADHKDAVEVPVDTAPRSELVDQRPRTEDIGDVPGKKGGVETGPDPVASVG